MGGRPLSSSRCICPGPGKKIGMDQPPFSQVAQMLDKIVRDQAGVLVCLAMWTSQPWWGKLQLAPPLLSERWGYLEAHTENRSPHRLEQPFLWLSEVDRCRPLEEVAGFGA